jgi:replicative DNA helicase
MSQKLPPQNLEAEISVLGGLMLEREAFDQVSDLISASDFYKPAHQVIYQTIADLHHKAEPVDLVTVSNSLQTKNELDQIGGPEYLLSLLDKVVSAANIDSHAKIIHEKSLLRRLIQTSSGFIEKAYGSDYENAESLIDYAESEILKVGEKKNAAGLIGPREIVTTSFNKMNDLFNRKVDVTGLPTGFADLDKMTSGLNAGELVIIAARPSMGKTAFSLNIASHISLRAKKTVAYFSVEMSKESLMMRLIAAEARVTIEEIKTGRILDTSWPRLIDACGKISDAKLFIDETSGISPYEIRARCRRLKAQHGVDCIMIDYLQLMELKQKVESRERAVAEISKSLKAIAKELQIPVIALAQLNRGVEGRSDRKPMLSDLRESGSIEQDADVIMMLYREDYYDKENPEKQGAAKVIIAKNRNGPTGDVDLRFDGKFNLFRDADKGTVSPLPPPQAPPSMQGSGFGGKPRNFAPGAR